MVTDLGRSPYGERGLKLRARLKPSFPTSRSPYGERGLKFFRRSRAAPFA